MYISKMENQTFKSDNIINNFEAKLILNVKFRLCCQLSWSCDGVKFVNYIYTHCFTSFPQKL